MNHWILFYAMLKKVRINSYLLFLHLGFDLLMSPCLFLEPILTKPIFLDIFFFLKNNKDSILSFLFTWSQPSTHTHPNNNETKSNWFQKSEKSVHTTKFSFHPSISTFLAALTPRHQKRIQRWRIPPQLMQLQVNVLYKKSILHSSSNYL